MATLDPARALFVLNAYRRQTVSDPAIAAAHPNAEDVTIDTNLIGVNALAMANKISTEGKKIALGLDITVQQNLPISALKTAVPLFNVLSSSFALTDTGRTFRLNGISTDWETGLDTVRVRG